MATRTSSLFERKPRDAQGEPAAYTRPMINSEMTGREWAVLLLLAVIWGGAFLFIGVAVRDVEPLTYVWLRLSIAAGAMWLFLKWRGEGLGLPREVWGSILLLALLNNALPFTLFGWGQTHIASGLASILNATTPFFAVIAAHVLTADERLTRNRLKRGRLRLAVVGRDVSRVRSVTFRINKKRIRVKRRLARADRRRAP